MAPGVGVDIVNEAPYGGHPHRGGIVVGAGNDQLARIVESAGRRQACTDYELVEVGFVGGSARRKCVRTVPRLYRGRLPRGQAGVRRDAARGGGGYFVGVCNLRGLKNAGAIEIRGIANAVDFRSDRGILIGDCGELIGSQAAISGLRGQRHSAVEQRGDLGKRAVSHLQLAYAVRGVLRGLLKRGNVGLQPVNNGQSGRIVSSTVDPRSRRQLEQGVLQVIVGDL